MHARTHTNKHTHHASRKPACANTHTRTQSHRHSHIQTDKHACTCTHTHTHTHTHGEAWGISAQSDPESHFSGRWKWGEKNGGVLLKRFHNGSRGLQQPSATSSLDDRFSEYLPSTRARTHIRTGPVRTLVGSTNLPHSGVRTLPGCGVRINTNMYLLYILYK